MYNIYIGLKKIAPQGSGTIRSYGLVGGTVTLWRRGFVVSCTLKILPSLSDTSCSL